MQLITASAQFVILCYHCMRMCVRCQKKFVYVLRHCENVELLLLFHRAQLSHRLIESHFADSNGYTVANIQWVYGYSLKFIPCLIFATTVTVSANRGAGSYLISIQMITIVQLPTELGSFIQSKSQAYWIVAEWPVIISSFVRKQSKKKNGTL